MVALSDVLTLNKLVEMILMSAEKSIDPPNLTTERGLLSDLNLGSGGLTVVRNINDLKPYISGANFSVGELNREKLQAQVQAAFYVDQLQLKESPAMTATEVQARMQLMQRLIGPTLARLQNDFLDPLVSRTFRILWRSGRLPQAPQSVIDAKAELNIEYVSPFYRAQRSGEVAAIQQWVGFLASLQPVAPDILDNVDFDDVASVTARIMGVPASVQSTDDEVIKARRKREANIQKMQTTARMQELAKASKDMAQAQALTSGEMQ
jgi:hypothetical protein